MINSSRIRIVGSALAVGLLVAVAGPAIATGPNGLSESEAKPVKYKDVVALGLDPAAAKLNSRTAAGFSVGALKGKGAGCLLLSTGSDFCLPKKEVDAGRLLNIWNDCSVPNGRMTVAGLLPDGAVTATIGGAHGGVATVDGELFTLESTTPAAAAKGPVDVTFEDAKGATVLTVPFPISAAQFCPPVS